MLSLRYMKFEGPPSQIMELGNLSDKSDGEGGKEEKDNRRRQLRSGREVHVDDQAEERRMKHVQLRNAYSSLDRPIPQTQSFSFQSSTVTYGGPNGAYYTSSTTRRAGGDGRAKKRILLLVKRHIKFLEEFMIRSRRVLNLITSHCSMLSFKGIPYWMAPKENDAHKIYQGLNGDNDFKHRKAYKIFAREPRWANLRDDVLNHAGNIPRNVVRRTSDNSSPGNSVGSNNLWEDPDGLPIP
ncbi:hypothetical protein GIB67_031713 [Kingdonia uniflora]|uniref:Uncharacterized protein n=1 Tax=Kingdonia uniflora TaxID=39325 RepID=A0A7J7NKN0_9MAGN|nr:hypothetical protein GIB67_031713 [Kingdonia uniflora]